MRSLLTVLCLLIAAPAYAELNPRALPEGIRAEVTENSICTGVQNNLSNHPRNIFDRPRALGQTWYKNSQGQYLSFNCWHTEINYNPYAVVTRISIIYISDAETIKNLAAEERDSIQRAMMENQEKIKRSKYY